MKIFTNVVSIDVKGRRVSVSTTYTSANKTIEKKLKPFNGNVRFERAGPLTEEQEDIVEDLFAELAKTTRSTNKRAAVVSDDSSEEESEPETRKNKSSFKKRSKLDA